MSDGTHTVEDATTKCGLMMESAQAHQRLAEAHLEQLREHTLGLDGVVRDEIRRTLIEELQMLVSESKRATAALQKMGRNASLRVGLWGAVVTLLCSGIPAAILLLGLPSEAEISSLRARRDQLTASVDKLERLGGRIEWRHCGDAARLCIRVEPNSPKYGDKADYYIVAGY